MYVHLHKIDLYIHKGSQYYELQFRSKRVAGFLTVLRISIPNYEMVLVQMYRMLILE
jgi:hypothetical protein